MVKEKQLEGRYKRIYAQLKILLQKTENKIARMSTTAALLHNKMPHFFWTGFYIIKDKILIIGPYQGPLACQVLDYPEGVCWKSVLEKSTIVVPDVHNFPSHIGCDRRSNSEIAIPLFNEKNQVWAVLDIDSQKFDAFSDTDKEWLEKIASLI